MLPPIRSRADRFRSGIRGFRIWKNRSAGIWKTGG